MIRTECIEYEASIETLKGIYFFNTAQLIEKIADSCNLDSG